MYAIKKKKKKKKKSEMSSECSLCVLFGFQIFRRSNSTATRKGS